MLRVLVLCIQHKVCTSVPPPECRARRHSVFLIRRRRLQAAEGLESSRPASVLRAKSCTSGW